MTNPHRIDGSGNYLSLYRDNLNPIAAVRLIFAQINDTNTTVLLAVGKLEWDGLTLSKAKWQCYAGISLVRDWLPICSS